MESKLKMTLRDLRNILPYLKDWDQWQREIARLERNMVKLRKHRFNKLGRTLENSLITLRRVLNEEKKQHAFTVNHLLMRLSKQDNLRRSRKR